MRAVEETLLESANTQKNLLIIGYDLDQYHALHYRCALSLNVTLNQYFQTVHVIPQTELHRRHEVGGEYVPFANGLFSDGRLKVIFGPPPASSSIRKFSESPKPDELIAIYEFTSDSVTSGDTGQTGSPNY